MLDFDEITSLVNPRVKRLIRLRKPRLRREEGVLLAEGLREVTRGLRAGLVLREVWVCSVLVQPDALPEGEADFNFKAILESGLKTPASFPGVRPVHASEAVFRKIAYHRDPEGLLAVFEAPCPGLEDLNLQRGRLLVAVGTEKPGNLGAMVRTAAAAGCDAVLLRIALGLKTSTAGPVSYTHLTLPTKA